MQANRNWKMEIGNWNGATSVPSFHFLISSFLLRHGTLLAGIAALAVSLVPHAAYAQGCAMCYTTAASAKAAAVQALRSGVEILLFPPLIMFGIIFYVIYKRRNRFADSAEWTAAQECELGQMLAVMESERKLEGNEKKASVAPCP